MRSYKYIPFEPKRWLVAIVILVAIGCSYQRSPITGDKTAYGYSWEQELRIGREADPQIAAEFGVYDDEAVAQYVREVGERVLAESHLRRPDTPEQYRIDFTFRVLNDPILNAFALPGGYVYVTRGLLAHMDSEAQLAMVLGHEIAHVAARHASKQAFKSQISQLGLLGGAIAGEVLAGAGAEMMQIGGVATQLLLLSYSRGAETESDELGVEYAAKAGYQAGEGAGFFETLKRVSEKSGARIPSWQSTHPDPGDREVKISQMAAEWSQQLEMDDVGRDRLLDAIDGIVVGTNPREGFTENNTFYHPDLAFSFPVPNQWTVYNMTTKVAMVDGEQQAVIIVSLANAESPSEAASTFAESNQINVTDHGSTTISGFDAYVLEGSFTQNQQTLRLVVHFIEYDGRIYQFVGYTDARRFEAFASRLTTPARGFKRVTDRRILNRQPDRLQVVTSQRSGSLSSFVEDLPAQFVAEDVAILNQLDLSSSIPVGRRIKLVD